MIIFYSGLLLFLHSLMFQELNQHGHFFQVTWNNVGQSIVNSDQTMPIGGGLIGAGLYSITNVLLGQTGSVAFAWLLMIIGVVIFLNCLGTK